MVWVYATVHVCRPCRQQRTSQVTDVCWRMLTCTMMVTYAEVCWHMVTCTPQVWWRMLTYTDVYWRILTYTDVYWRILTCILTYTDVCWRMLTCILTYPDVCWRVSWRILTYPDISWRVWWRVWWRMLTYVDVCWRPVMSVDVTWHWWEHSRLVRFYKIRDTRSEMLWKNVLSPFQKLVGALSKTCFCPSSRVFLNEWCIPYQ